MASIFSGKAGRRASMAMEDAAGKGFTAASDALDKGYSSAADYYRQAGDLYAPAANDYGAYSGMYKNAVGLGGEDGSAAATTAFRSANPGYSFMFDQGQQALARQMAASGRGASGNAMIEAQRYGQGLADQSYQQWLNNLSRGQQQSFQGVQGQAGTLGTLGASSANRGRDLAALTTDYYDKLGSARASGQLAGQQAAANRFGAGLAIGNTLASLVGNFAGAGAFSGFGIPGTGNVKK